MQERLEDELKTAILTFRVTESLKKILREKYGSDGELSKLLQEYASQLASK
jgi:hypothetical protein